MYDIRIVGSVANSLRDMLKKKPIRKCLRYHGRWIDSVWKSRSHKDALEENPINLTFSESLIVLKYNRIIEIF